MTPTMPSAALDAPTELATPVAYDPFADGELSRVVPTTEPQREVWLADRLGRDASLAFNESVSLLLRGPLDIAALESALQALVRRHDALRASFGPDGETLCVRAAIDLALPLYDLQPLAEASREAAVAGHLHRVVETPFDLARDALLRAELLRLDPQTHRLLLTAHHIVCDGWSWWVIVRELGALYAQAEASGFAAEVQTSRSIGSMLPHGRHPGRPRNPGCRSNTAITMRAGNAAASSPPSQAPSTRWSS